MTTTDPNAPDAALLPCPFCGAAGEILETQAGQAAAFCTLYRADCSERGCADMPWEADKADIIAAWNRRAGQAHERSADAGLLAALEALVTAVTYADPPKLFNGVLGHEARVPVEFVTEARAAITAAKGHDNEG